MVEVDRQRNVAAGTVRVASTIPFKGLDVIPGALAAEFMATARTNGLFGCFVADTAYQYVLAAFCFPLQKKIRVVGDLTHLHDQAKDICVIVQHDSAADIGVKLSSGVGHDAGGEVALDFAEEFVVDYDPAVPISPEISLITIVAGGSK